MRDLERALLGFHGPAPWIVSERRWWWFVVVILDGVAVHDRVVAVAVAVVGQSRPHLPDLEPPEVHGLAMDVVDEDARELAVAALVLYHRLVLARAPGVELPKVVSEGEQRCLAIASFFAELSTADDRSAIVFDDPVSSLDYMWRESVARRLVEEAKTRRSGTVTRDWHEPKMDRVLLAHVEATR